MDVVVKGRNVEVPGHYRAHVVEKLHKIERAMRGGLGCAVEEGTGFVTAAMLKPGTAVLDVGVSRVDGKIAGDVAPDVAEVAGFVAPNPGGVGPMTRAMLLTNVIDAAEAAHPR